MQHRFGVKHWILVGSLYGVLGVLTIVFHTKFNCAQLCYHIVFYAAVRAAAVKHGEDVQEYYEKLISSEKDKETTM